MNKAITALFAFLTLGGIIKGTLLIQKENRQDAELARLKDQLQSATADAKHWEAEYQKLKGTVALSEDQIKQELASLQAQLRMQQSSLNASKIKLDLAKAAPSGGNQDIAQHVRDDENSIQNLQTHLKNYQADEKQIDQQANATVQSQKDEQKYQRDLMNGQLKSLNDSLKFSKDQLNYWRGQKHDPNYNLKLSDYQNQVNQIQSQISELKVRQVQLDKQIGEQSNLVRSEASIDRTNVKMSEQQIQQKIGELQKDLKDWQNRQNSANSKSAEQAQAIQHAQAEYDELQIQIAATNDQIHAKQEELTHVLQSAK